jgi:small subunit ribosomal protein S13
MARIAGVELDDQWKIGFALTRIKGIGWPTSRKILRDLGIGLTKKISDLDAGELVKITSEVEKGVIEGDLVRSVHSNIQRLKAIGSYRGIRHSRNLPVRGQRTRRNARTKRGKRKTVGAFKKEMLIKQAQANKGSNK